MFDLLGKSIFVSCIPESAPVLMKLPIDLLSSNVDMGQPSNRLNNVGQQWNFTKKGDGGEQGLLSAKRMAEFTLLHIMMLTKSLWWYY